MFSTCHVSYLWDGSVLLDEQNGRHIRRDGSNGGQALASPTGPAAFRRRDPLEAANSLPHPLVRQAARLRLGLSLIS